MLRTESDTGGSLIVLGFHPAEVLSLPAGCPVSEDKWLSARRCGAFLTYLFGISVHLPPQRRQVAWR